MHLGEGRSQLGASSTRPSSLLLLPELIFLFLFPGQKLCSTYRLSLAKPLVAEDGLNHSVGTSSSEAIS